MTRSEICNRLIHWMYLFQDPAVPLDELSLEDNLVNMLEIMEVAFSSGFDARLLIHMEKYVKAMVSFTKEIYDEQNRNLQ